MARPGRLILMVLFLVCACGGPKHAGALTVPHPDKSSAQVEYFVKAPQGKGPWPTVVLLHGAQPLWSLSRGNGGYAFVGYGALDQFASKGYLAVAVSLPGYGNSSGPDDFAGSFTQHAVSGVITKLKADGLADPNRVLIEGISLGAVTAALIAAHDPSVAGIVLISGLYDMPVFFEHPQSLQAGLLKYQIRYVLGVDNDALRTRSALGLAEDIKAKTLVLSGAQDDRTDPQQARLLVDKINSHGGVAQIHIYPEYGHQIPFDIRKDEVDTFIASVFRPTS